MKLSVFSDDLAAGWERAIEVAREAGVQGLEVRNVWGRSSKDLTDEDARRMAAALRGTGLGVSCMGSTFGRRFWLDDDESRKMSEDVLAKMIRFCDILGTDKIRIFALWIPGYEEDRSLWPVRPRFTLDLLARLARNLINSVRMAERAGVQMLIENEGNSYSGTCREARVIMDALDSPAVRCIYHPRPLETTGEPAFPEGYRQVSGHISHVHMGRLDYLLDGTPPNVPHREIVHTLADDGYDGWITIERHFHPRDPEREPELRQRTLADIAAVRGFIAEATAGR